MDGAPRGLCLLEVCGTQGLSKVTTISRLAAEEALKQGWLWWLALAVGWARGLVVGVELPALVAMAVARAVPGARTLDYGFKKHIGREFTIVHATSPLPFSSSLPKIILPLAVCSTEVTAMSTLFPMSLRA
jgi:hypothetical protein